MNEKAIFKQELGFGFCILVSGIVVAAFTSLVMRRSPSEILIYKVGFCLSCLLLLAGIWYLAECLCDYRRHKMISRRLTEQQSVDDKIKMLLTMPSADMDAYLRFCRRRDLCLLRDNYPRYAEAGYVSFSELLRRTDFYLYRRKKSYFV